MKKILIIPPTSASSGATRWVVSVAAIIISGMVIGVVSAGLAVREVAKAGSLHNGPWTTPIDAGSLKRGPYLRAAVALGATLALSRQETIYFFANHDDSGARLDPACNYVLTGPDLPARWWSVTLYGAKNYMAPNPENRWSYASITVAHDPDGGITIAISRNPQKDNWLDPGAASEINLIARLYQPGANAASDPASIALPKIIKKGCS